MLYIGEKVGTGGPAIDIALDPLEGTTLTAKAMANALAVMACAPRGGMLHAPDTYMDKIACGPGYPEGVLDLDASPPTTRAPSPRPRACALSEVTACVLDRPRHADIIASLREAGVRVHLITDGDVAGVINTADPDTGIDIYIGQGGAPEGVLACAALKCVGGQFQGRLVFRNDDERARAKRLGVRPTSTSKYDLHEMVERRRDLRRHRRHRRRPAARREVQGRLRPYPHPGDEFRQPDRARSADEAAAVTDGRSSTAQPTFWASHRSLTGTRWRRRAADPTLTRAHQARLGLCEPIARALAARGVGSGARRALSAPDAEGAVSRSVVVRRHGSGRAADRRRARERSADRGVRRL